MHILQREAKATELRDILDTGDAQYDFAAGVWRSTDGLTTFDSRYRTQTKKADLETGEDQKGQ